MRRLYVDGVDPMPIDAIVPDAACEYYAHYRQSCPRRAPPDT